MKKVYRILLAAAGGTGERGRNILRPYTSRLREKVETT